MPPRPAPGSCSRALKRTSAPPAPSRPAPPRPHVAALRPPPLPKIAEPDAEPLDFQEEMDDTEWHDVSGLVETSRPPAPPVTADTPDTADAADTDDMPAFRSPVGAQLATTARTTVFFVRFLSEDVIGVVRNVLPAMRALAARLGVQWRRASEHARSA